MKITLNVDDALLRSVMEAAGTTNKTRAIDLALREMDRRTKLANLARAGLGMTGAELKDALDPVYDLNAMRRRETPVIYGRKSRSR